MASPAIHDGNPSAQPANAARRGREYLLRAFLILGSVLVALLLAEIFLRFTTPKEILREAFIGPDRTMHHRFIPGAHGQYQSPEFDTHYTINSLGLRDREFDVPKPPHRVRILMLGDSFTEGDGVESNETSSKQLETLLASDSTLPPCEVVNAGVGSYSPLLEYLYLKYEGLKLQPDLVILNFDLSDVYDDLEYSKYLQADSSGMPESVTHPVLDAPSAGDRGFAGVLTDLKDFVKAHTRLYSILRIRLNRYVEGMRHEGDFSGDIRFDKYAMFRENAQAGKDSSWGLTYRYLLHIRDLLRHHGVQLLVVVYPYGHQVSPREWNVGRVFWGFQPDSLYGTEPQAWAEHFCRRNGIAVINLCEGFRAASRSVYPLYLADNGHWLPAGHRVVAACLQEEIRPLLLARTRNLSAGRSTSVPEAKPRPSGPHRPEGRENNGSRAKRLATQ